MPGSPASIMAFHILGPLEPGRQPRARGGSSGIDSVNDLRSHVRSRQRQRRLCPHQAHPGLRIRDVPRPRAGRALHRARQHPAGRARRRGLIGGDNVHHPSSGLLALDANHRHPVDAQQPRRPGFDAVLNVTNVRTLNQGP